MYSSFQVMYTVGYSLSLGALLLALAILLGLRYAHRPAHGGPQRAGWAGTDSLSPQQAALHPKLHPREPVCVLRAQGQLCAGH